MTRDRFGASLRPLTYDAVVSAVCCVIFCAVFAAGCGESGIPDAGADNGPDVAIDVVGDTGGDAHQDQAMDSVEDSGWEIEPDILLEDADPGVDVSNVPMAVRFDGPRSVPPGAMVPVVVTIDDSRYTNLLTITAGGDQYSVRVARGRGSILVKVPTVAGEWPLKVDQAGFEGSLDVQVETRDVRTVSGQLAGDDLSWGPASDIQVASDATIPAGQTLTVAAGTRVKLASKARLLVKGRLDVQGTADSPVWFMPSETSWGEVYVMTPSQTGGTDGTAVFAWTWLTGGGGDSAKAFGHSKSQPVIRTDVNATLSMNGGGITDCPGKAFGSQNGVVTYENALISRVDTGGEHKVSTVTMRGCHVIDIPSADDTPADDDNDGVYLSDVDGTGGNCIVEDCVFYHTKDDAIDHNGAKLTINRVWIYGAANEGLAASKGRDVTISNTMISGCEQGIEAGYGAPKVHVLNCLVIDNGVGLRWGDAYGDAAFFSGGTMDVVDTVSVNNINKNILFWDDQQGDAPVGTVSISCSYVDSPDWDGKNNNQAGMPQWTAWGCITGFPGSRPEGCGDLGPQEGVCAE